MAEELVENLEIFLSSDQEKQAYIDLYLAISVKVGDLNKPVVKRFKIKNMDSYRYLKPCLDGAVLASNALLAPMDQWVELETEEI